MSQHKEKCAHMTFAAEVNVSRLQASATDTTIVGFAADVQIRCSDCGKPFQFVGLPIGPGNLQRPMVSPDGLKAAMPIQPKGIVMLHDLNIGKRQ
jgi:hypothetical protein